MKGLLVAAGLWQRIKIQNAVVFAEDRMLGSALYYPHIDIRDANWLRSAVLFWDEIKTIAPRAISKPYENNDTNILWREGFLEPLRCDLHPELLDTLGKRVVGLMDSGYFRRDLDSDALRESDPNSFALMHADKIGMSIRNQFDYAHLHPEKLSPEMRSLAMRAGLAHMHPGKLGPELLNFLNDFEFLSMHPEKMSPHMRERIRSASRRYNNDGNWLLVDGRFAEVYMAALAALLSKEADLSALTNEEPSLGVNLHALLEDVKPSSPSDKKGALVSFVMEILKVDPTTKIERLVQFRRSRESQLAELTAQFEDLSSKMANCETAKELNEKAKDAYVTRIRPKLESLKDELGDISIQAQWDGFSRAIQVTAPGASALGYFGQLTALSGGVMLAAGAGIAITEIAIKTHLARKKARRASPFTYLLDVERKFSMQAY